MSCMYLQWFYADFPDERDEIQRQLKRYIEIHKRNLWVVETTMADLSETIN